MILSTARALLERRTLDESNDTWTDAELNEIINEAILQEQLEVMAVNPSAFLRIWRADTVAAQQFYDIPSGMMYEIEVGVTDSEDPTGYAPLTLLDWDMVRGKSRSASDLTYARFTDKFYIGRPITASNAVSNGLRVIGVPSLSVGADDALLPLHIALHYAVVIRAQIILNGEGGEGNDKLWEELLRIHKNIPQLYPRSGAQSEAIRPDVDKGY